MIRAILWSISSGYNLNQTFNIIFILTGEIEKWTISWCQGLWIIEFDGFGIGGWPWKWENGEFLWKWLSGKWNCTPQVLLRKEKRAVGPGPDGLVRFSLRTKPAVYRSHDSPNLYCKRGETIVRRQKRAVDLSRIVFSLNWHRIFTTSASFSMYSLSAHLMLSG